MTTDNSTPQDVNSQETEQIITRFPMGMFNNLEQAIAQQVTIEFLHWLQRVRRDLPETMTIAGTAVTIGFPKNHLDIYWHEGDCRRPKRLRWQVSIELNDYQQGSTDTLLLSLDDPTQGGAS